MKKQFIQAIKNRYKVELVFFSKEDGHVLTRLCAPLDFGPSRRAINKSGRYHLWDYESDTKNHILSLSPEQIKSVKILDSEFNPGEFITWDTKKSPWFIDRDWGQYS